VEAFERVPTATDVCSVLEDARAAAEARPKYCVTDQGPQFRSEYRQWCQRRGVNPRFGAVGAHGSISIVERFILSLKTEAFGIGIVPLGARATQHLLESYATWYATERPHQGLGGRTPLEVFDERKPDHRRPRLEPRARYPSSAPCAGPRVPVRGRRGPKIELMVSHPTGTPHLPVVRLRRAA